MLRTWGARGADARAPRGSGLGHGSGSLEVTSGSRLAKPTRSTCCGRGHRALECGRSDLAQAAGGRTRKSRGHAGEAGSQTEPDPVRQPPPRPVLPGPGSRPQACSGWRQWPRRASSPAPRERGRRASSCPAQRTACPAGRVRTGAGSRSVFLKVRRRGATGRGGPRDFRKCCSPAPSVWPRPQRGIGAPGPAHTPGPAHAPAPAARAAVSCLLWLSRASCLIFRWGSEHAQTHTPGGAIPRLHPNNATTSRNIKNFLNDLSLRRATHDRSGKMLFS